MSFTCLIYLIDFVTFLVILCLMLFNLVLGLLSSAPPNLINGSFCSSWFETGCHLIHLNCLLFSSSFFYFINTSFYEYIPIPDLAFDRIFSISSMSSWLPRREPITLGASSGPFLDTMTFDTFESLEAWDSKSLVTNFFISGVLSASLTSIDGSLAPSRLC